MRSVTFTTGLFVIFTLACSWCLVLTADFAKSKIDVKLVESFPLYKNFGQLSAVSVDQKGNVFVFHRGDQVWDHNSFGMNNVYLKVSQGPIKMNTIAVLDPATGSLIKETGSGMFYLPHGLTVDHEDNIWVTDVALHQVVKFPPMDLHSNKTLGGPLLALGTGLEPGNDDRHFCKPTSVAVDSISGEFYVADGYCNSRIIKYNKRGIKLIEWGRRTTGKLTHYSLNVPHSLALDEQKQILYVADRENARVVAYNSKDGHFMKTYGEVERSRVFGVALSAKQGWLLAADAPSFPATAYNPGAVVAYDISTGQPQALIAPPQHFQNPHDIAVSPDSKFIYVVELNPYKVWQFQIGTVHDMASTVSTVESKVSTTIEPVVVQTGDQASSLSGSQLAATIVTFVVLITLAIFMVHVYNRKGGYRGYEMKGLILDEHEDDDG